MEALYLFINMYWTLLIIAGLLEAGWATALRYSEGFSKLWPSVYTVILMVLSMGLLSYATRYIHVGTAYVVWTGIGAISTTIVGLFLFNESMEFVRLFFIFLIVTGVIGLHLLEKA